MSVSLQAVMTTLLTGTRVMWTAGVGCVICVVRVMHAMSTLTVLLVCALKMLYVLSPRAWMVCRMVTRQTLTVGVGVTPLARDAPWTARVYGMWTVRLGCVTPLSLCVMHRPAAMGP
eukprot:TRINITY_DN17480_c0_g1::TRINITY_DN17480_c0_g1_i1::g.28037::m.28037 TRINITY_DN17480_c0_g1::TRINITY_DN17480_c0_g1_i1::g.28037  ORF type:complete len:117 (+),score=2.06,DUF3767/PF12597.3/3.1e+02,DUF3767/PF12597.3/2.3 TRINITY_DN17480_c0_g1_i1:198-548(+)